MLNIILLRKETGDVAIDSNADTTEHTRTTAPGGIELDMDAMPQSTHARLAWSSNPGLRISFLQMVGFGKCWARKKLKLRLSSGEILGISDFSHLVLPRVRSICTTPASF